MPAPHLTARKPSPDHRKGSAVTKPALQLPPVLTTQLWHLHTVQSFTEQVLSISACSPSCDSLEPSPLTNKH